MVTFGKIDHWIHVMLEKENLLKLARIQMPFGKYAGRVLIDLPEEYLLWFDKKGWPEGELGDLLKLCLALKIEGLDSVVKPLKRIWPVIETPHF